MNCILFRRPKGMGSVLVTIFIKETIFGLDQRSAMLRQGEPCVRPYSPLTLNLAEDKTNSLFFFESITAYQVGRSMSMAYTRGTAALLPLEKWCVRFSD